jgi:hypothetical protein
MLVPALYGIGVDISRFFKGLWTGVKQPPLGSKYDPDMVLALEGMDIADDLDSVEQFGTGPVPSPAE